MGVPRDRSPNSLPSSLFAKEPAQQSPSRLPSSLASGEIADLRSRLLAGVPVGLAVGVRCVLPSSLPLPGHWPNGLSSGGLPSDQPSTALSGPTNSLLSNLPTVLPSSLPSCLPASLPRRLPCSLPKGLQRST